MEFSSSLNNDLLIPTHQHLLYLFLPILEEESYIPSFVDPSCKDDLFTE